MTMPEGYSTERRSGRLLKMKDVVEQTSLHRATIYRLEARGEFPKRRQITRGRVGWWESDVEAWKIQRQAAAD
jgi:prophage regulatory protein